MKPHEEQILRVLADSIRVLTLRQIAKTWWTDTRWGRTRASAAMNDLAREGWLHVQRLLSRTIQSFVDPLVDWQPKDRRPDFASVARRLHRRAMVAAKPVKVVYAAKRAVTFFGNGRAPAIKLTQMTHDLNVSELYLHYRRNGFARCLWLSEDRLPRDWPLRERPDALLKNHRGQLLRAVEYGGDYPVSRLVELHTGLASINLGYHLW